jgi:hypothetical protein
MQELPRFSAQYGAATTQTPLRPRGWIFCDDISEFTLAQFLFGRTINLSKI